MKLGLASFLLAVSATTGLFAADAPPLTILDWNIDRGYDLNVIATSIREQKADVALLQEVDLNDLRTARKDVAKELAGMLGLKFAFGKAFQEVNQGTAEQPAFQGQATLTKLPIKTSRVLEFKHQTDFWKPQPYLPSWFPQRRLGGRVALITELDASGKTLVVYNLHLESRGPGYTRYGQLQEVIEDARRYSANVPVVLAGDINAKYLPGKFSGQLEIAGFHDCFGGHRPRTHRILFSLDWMFVRGPLTCEGARVVHEAKGSDHYPLAAQIHVR